MNSNNLIKRFGVNHYYVKIIKKNMNPFQYIVSVLSYSIFIFLLLIGATLLIYVLDIKTRASRGDYSSPKFNAYVVLTGSMIPKVKVNDVVVTKKVKTNTLKKGDVITFKSSDPRFLGTVITHRIVEVNDNSTTGEKNYVTKGDNNNTKDEALVRESDIFGKVVLNIPKLGYIQYMLATNGGWIIFILIPCLAILSYDIYKVFKSTRKKATGKNKYA